MIQSDWSRRYGSMRSRSMPKLFERYTQLPGPEKRGRAETAIKSGEEELSCGSEERGEVLVGIEDLQVVELLRDTM